MMCCCKKAVEKDENEAPASPFQPKVMYEPLRRVLNFRHIQQINTMIFHFRELSRQVTLQLGVVPSTVVSQLRSLIQRIVDNVELLETDMVRNERAPFEAKLEYYRSEYQEINILYNELVNILNNTPPQ